MSSSASPSMSPTGRERRRQVRVTFSPVRRPRLRLANGVYDVLDASLDGLRVRHTDPVRPPVGGRIAAALEWPDLSTPVVITGRVVRVEHTEFALSCEKGQLPVAHILAEAARRRDVQEAADLGTQSQ